MQDYEKDEAAEVSHQPVKPEFTRKKVREATGDAKFNFTGTYTVKYRVEGSIGYIHATDTIVDDHILVCSSRRQR